MGCTGWCATHLGQDPQSGHLFLFTNRSHTRLKVLVSDGSGLWLCAKRLERGRFGWPAANGTRCVLLRPKELAMLVRLGSDASAPAQELAGAYACGIAPETFPAVHVVGLNTCKHRRKRSESAGFEPAIRVV
jgi:transposase